MYRMRLCDSVLLFDDRPVRREFQISITRFSRAHLNPQDRVTEKVKTEIQKAEESQFLMGVEPVPRTYRTM